MLKLFYLPPVQPGDFSCLFGDIKRRSKQYTAYSDMSRGSKKDTVFSRAFRLKRKNLRCATCSPQVWQGQKDLNPRHVVLETTALPTELYPCMTVNQVRLKPLHRNGGEDGIRTHAALANPNDLANRPLQPLEYFSRLN